MRWKWSLEKKEIGKEEKKSKDKEESEDDEHFEAQPLGWG